MAIRVREEPTDDGDLKPGRAHWHGNNPLVACASMTLEAGSAADARQLARLNRLCSRPETLARLMDLAEQLDAQAEAEIAAGGTEHEGHGHEHPDRCPHCGAVPELAESFGA